jgi:hypothetical protein
MADKNLTKTISFPSEYEKEYQYLVKQDNASRYVCKLIREDMEGKKNLKELIKETVEEVLKDKNYNVSKQEDLTNAVNDLFN